MNLGNDLSKKKPLKKEERIKIILDTAIEASGVDKESKMFLAGFLTGIQLKAESKKLDHS